MDKQQAIEILEKRKEENGYIANRLHSVPKYQGIRTAPELENMAINMALDSLKGIRPKTDKLDDKKEICKALVPVLQMTRNLYDLVDLEYRVEEGMELVIATFDSGFIKTVNVNLDSGTSMIRDIIYQIV